MTSTPGPAPGSSDSPEPDDGAGPTTKPGPQPPQDGVPRQGQPGQSPPPGPPVPPPGYGQQQPYNGGPQWGPAAGGWQQYPQASWGVPVPAAPKPGVIPLRPLGFGDILDGAIATLRRHWRALLGTTVVVGALTQTANVVIEHQFIDHDSLNELQDKSDPTASDVLHAVGGSLAASGLSVLVTIIGTIVATSMLTMVISRAVLGRPVTAREAWTSARPQVPRLLGLMVLTPLILCAVLAVSALPGGLVALIGSDDGGAALAVLGLLAGSLVSVWLWVQWSLAAPALMLERQGVIASMKRSAKLVSGAWWRVLGVQLLAVILILIASAIIELPFNLIGAGVSGQSASGLFSTDNTSHWSYLIFVAIGGTIGSALTLPISAGVTALLYMDQRIRRESLDLELIRATQSGS